MRLMSEFSPPARGVLVAGACALVIGFLKLAAPVLEPILLAVFIAIVATPALQWMRRHGVPKWGALALITFVLRDAGQSVHAHDDRLLVGIFLAVSLTSALVIALDASPHTKPLAILLGTNPAGGSSGM